MVIETIKAKRLFNRKDWRLCIDQYGNKVYARTAKELKERSGCAGKIFKIYVDRKGETYHVGYGIGRYWFNIFADISVLVK